MDRSRAGSDGAGRSNQVVTEGIMAHSSGRFFWVKVTEDMPWTVAELCHEDPNIYWLIGSEWGTPIFREGPEIFPPEDNA